MSIKPVKKDNNSLAVIEPNDEIIENQKIYYEMYDKEFAQLFIDKIMKYIAEYWYRAELVNFEDYPERVNENHPLIFASNHSGMAFPWDGMVFAYKINQIHGFSTKAIRPLSSPMLSMSALMNPFQIPNMWKRLGAIDATFKNFETMMHYKGQNILIYPEGVPGIGKGFGKKYQLQELKTSFLRMSVKFKTDIIPILTVNGEYINPYSYSNNAINKLVNLLGIPFLPLGLITFAIFLQPWAFYIGFPSKLIYVMGKPIKPYNMIDKPYDEITQEEFKELSSRITPLMQAELTEAVAKYGKRPYKDFFKTLFKNIRYLPYILPTSWPALFCEFETKYKKKEDKDFEFKANFFSIIWFMIKNPISFAYFIPFLGWIPLIINGYRNNTVKRVKRV